MRWLVFLLMAPFWVVNGFAEFPGYAHPVMTWVPPYAVKKALARLRDTPGVTDGLTHLALQFWTPTAEGGIARVSRFDDLSDAMIGEFRAWAHAHGVRVMLCVYNGVEKWDWPLAQAAFAGHPKEFATALLEEAKRLDLDGIDLDLEGLGEFDADKGAFVTCTRQLAKQAHAAGRQVTVDTFAYIWNAPNQTWWGDLLPHVDALTSMGYEETGGQSDDWHAYGAQNAAAGKESAKLMMGLPTHKEQWQGTKAIDHLRWLHDHGVGAALWDATFATPPWRSPEVWGLLRQIRGGPSPGK